jgi:hypothetical protein
MAATFTAVIRLAGSAARGGALLTILGSARF